jgi:hypothetical protein
LPGKVFDVLFSRLFTSFQLYGISTVFAVIAHTVITIILYFLTTWFKLQGYFIALLMGYYLIMPVTFLLIIKYKIAAIKISVIVKDTLILFGTAVLIYFLANYLFQIVTLNFFIKIPLLCAIVAIPFILVVNWLLDIEYQKKLFLKLINKKTLNRK